MRERLIRDEAVDYQTRRWNEKWEEHHLRTLVTASVIAWMEPVSILDPACGDGSIVSAALRLRKIRHVYLNDISTPSIEALRVASGLSLATAGAKLSNLPIADLLATMTGGVDVIVLTEILEHLEDPDLVLRLARKKGKRLVASSPHMRPGQVDDNPEHLWMFDREGYGTMLYESGWQVNQYTFLDFPSLYQFGIWACSARE